MPFLKLEDIIIHPFLSWIISALFILGIIRLSLFALKIMDIRKPRIIDIASCSIVLSGVIAVIVQLLAITHNLNIILKTCGYAICLLGLLLVLSSRKQLKVTTASYLKVFKISCLPVKLEIVLISLTIFLFFLCVCGPVTDVDSLDYHIGYPLEILRNGGMVTSDFWLHTRLTGLGEYLNLFGLIMGTDNLGAFFQFSGLVMVSILLASIVNDNSRRVLMLKMLLSSFALLFLIPNQKPQFIGTAALVTGIMLCLETDIFNSKRLFLAAGCLLFGMSLKYSFYISGTIFAVFIFTRSIQKKKALQCVFWFAFFYLLFLFPTHLFNLIKYGDPVSPFLSSVLKPEGYEYVSDFSVLLKNSSYNGYPVPLGLIIPKSLGLIPYSIGIGMLGLFICRKLDKKTLSVLVLSVISFIIISLTRGSARYFMEAYILLIIVVGLCPVLSRFKGLFSFCLSCQLLIVLSMLIVGVVILFPGSISFQLRDKVMARTACEYSAMKWLDGELPENSKIISSFRSNSLLPRSFIAQHYRNYAKYHKSEFLRRIEEDLSRNNYYFINSSQINKSHLLAGYIDITSHKTFEFVNGTRNPLNRRKRVMHLYKLCMMPGGAQ